MALEFFAVLTADKGHCGADQVSTGKSSCTQSPYAGGVLPAGPNCLHSVGIWQIWPVDATADFVLLGDLSKYVSLSGYRLRLPEHQRGTRAEQHSAEHLVVVGMPSERVELTYLRRGVSEAWVVHVQAIVIGTTGRTEVTLA